MKKRCLKAALPVLLIGGALLIAILIPTIHLQGNAAEMPADTDCLLTVDGYPVAQEEFMLFLQDERAMTAAYYANEYGVQLTDQDWTRSIDGKTPLDHAKSAALRKLIEVKEEAVLLHERGLLEEFGYDQFLSELTRTNAERSAKEAAGEAYYGLTQYDPATYYRYLCATRRAQLLQSQQELYPPDETALRALYKRDFALYTQGNSLTFEAQYADGTAEKITATEFTVEKEDFETQALLQQLSGNLPGDTLQCVYRGQPAVITLLECVPLGTADFESCRGMLSQTYTEEMLRALVTQRANEAKLKYHKAQYMALTF